MAAPKPNIVLIPSSWTKNNVRINVTLPTGVTASTVQRQVSLDNQDSWKNWTATISVSENQTVYARYTFKVDVTIGSIDYKAGDVSEIVSHDVSNIDKIPPEIMILAQEDGVKILNDTTSASEVSVNASDDTSGIKEFTYTKDSIGPVIVSGTMITLTEKGYYVFTVKDNAGNETIKDLILIDKPKIITTPPIENGGVYNFNVLISSDDTNVTLKVNDEVVPIPYNLQVTEGEEVNYDVELSDIYGSKDTLNFTLFKEKQVPLHTTKKYFTREEIQSILEENSYTAEVTYRDREKRDSPNSFIVYHKLPSNSFFADNILHVKTTLVQVSFFHKKKLDNIDKLMMDNFNVEPVAFDNKDMNSDYYADHYRFEIMTGGGW